ncbi:hypothetical protein E0Z10_g126 [Xylaria hypoxylon]|uniref:G protein-coupled receptor GPR1/2/3 C-terminal domain-containing protein n=1 Tax=Xylaria hypoxylon TaxID=37992 RepID=A0A4Z0ZG59_9PEZI|nr:hypothetical protein E0Z10_g126 [Xylaria hypoxylon]
MATGESSTLAPLPPVVHSGSIAIIIFALASFFASLSLFLYLTYNILRWRLGTRPSISRKRRPPGHMFANGPIEFGPAHDAAKLAGEEPTIDAISLTASDRTESPRYPNQFIVLFLNLLVADVHQAAAFGLIGTQNGASVGGFFVRAGPWCWINRQYGNIRLLTHYIFIFIAIFVSWALYTAIFISLRRQYRRGDFTNGENRGYHHPVFLIYPVIYLICILPLAIGRVLTMSGHEPSLGYFCASGVLVASNGWLDVIVFTTTRRSIVFAHGDELGSEDTGLDTFTFMTPSTFGNTVWVRGGHGEQPRKPPTGGWWRILGDPETQARRPSRLGKSLSQTSLTLPTERNAIQMEVITTVVVEDDRNTHMAAEASSTSTQSLKERPYR